MDGLKDLCASLLLLPFLIPAVVVGAVVYLLFLPFKWALERVAR